MNIGGTQLSENLHTPSRIVWWVVGNTQLSEDLHTPSRIMWWVVGNTQLSEDLHTPSRIVCCEPVIQDEACDLSSLTSSVIPLNLKVSISLPKSAARV